MQIIDKKSFTTIVVKRITIVIGVYFFLGIMINFSTLFYNMYHKTIFLEENCRYYGSNKNMKNLESLFNKSNYSYKEHILNFLISCSTAYSINNKSLVPMIMNNFFIIKEQSNPYLLYNVVSIGGLKTRNKSIDDVLSQILGVPSASVVKTSVYTSDVKTLQDAIQLYHYWKPIVEQSFMVEIKDPPVLSVDLYQNNHIYNKILFFILASIYCFVSVRRELIKRNKLKEMI